MNSDAWTEYLQASGHLHAFELDAASEHFHAAVRQRSIVEPQAAIDGLAGLAFSQRLLQHEGDARETMRSILRSYGQGC